MQLKEAYRNATALFKKRGWKVFKFQRETWKAYASGESGLVHAPTGTGKTYAVWVPPLLEWMVENKQTQPPKRTPGLRVLWITPLRALVEDTRISLLELCEEMDLPWTVEARTGDTSGANKTRQRKRLPSCLVTTPESLSVLLSYPDFKQSASELKAIIVDEWHELLSTKRGIQTELCLARLRKWIPRVRTWGLSATLGNLDVAKSALLGSSSEGRLIDGGLKKFSIESIIPQHGTLSVGGTLGRAGRTSRRKDKREQTSCSPASTLKPSTGSTLCSWSALVGGRWNPSARLIM